MINFNCTIYQDALSLLLGNKTNIRAEILGQLQQGDPCLEHIGDELCDLGKNHKINADKINDKFGEQSCEELMEYISFSDDTITFDYEESAECGDPRVCAFRIACKFDAERYLKEQIA